jgi:hypothetical protein
LQSWQKITSPLTNQDAVDVYVEVTQSKGKITWKIPADHFAVDHLTLRHACEGNVNVYTQL